MHDEIQASKRKEEEERRRKLNILSCFIYSDESEATDAPARTKIPGADLTDYIELGAVSPCKDSSDAINAFIMFSLVFYSVLKLLVLASGHLFLTLNSFPEWNISSFQVDALEMLIVSPRMLSVYTICFLSKSRFTGKKNSACAFQYIVLKNLP